MTEIILQVFLAAIVGLTILTFVGFLTMLAFFLVRDFKGQK